MDEFCYESFKKYKLQFHTQYVRIVFITDEVTNYSGFAMSWSTVSKEPTTDVTTVAPNQICNNPSSDVLLTNLKGTNECECLNTIGCKCYFRTVFSYINTEIYLCLFFVCALIIVPVLFYKIKACSTLIITQPFMIIITRVLQARIFKNRPAKIIKA